MESEIDVTGVITKIADDFCIVSLTINDVPKTFSFSKYLLYVFGLQCEGQMANILEEGMEVDVRYNLSKDNVPCIVAVWISEKPDHLKDAVLKPFYNERGSVIDLKDDNVLVQIDNSNETVLISKEVFFRDGNRTNSDSSLGIGDTVSFDAIPFESEHPTGAFYQATCAWVGCNPILIERFGLNMLTFDDSWNDEDQLEIVHGTVAVIPNKIVAFAEVENAQHNGKVMLFRSSFASREFCDIGDLIDVGDRLCMRIRYKCLTNGCRQVYAAEAWKDGREVIVDFETAAKQEEAKDVLQAITQQSIDEENSLPSSSQRKRSRQRYRPRRKDSSHESAAEQAHGDSPPITRGPSGERNEANTYSQVEIPKSEFNEHSQILINDPPLLGIISIISGETAYILYDSLKIFVNRRVIFCFGKQCTDDREYMMLVGKGDKEVFFEAIKYSANTSKSGFTHMATCVWIGKKPSITFVKRGDTPEPPVIVRTQSFSQTNTGSTSQLDERSEVLIGYPPLSGPISLVSRLCAVIRYEGFRIYVGHNDMYVDGQPCEKNQFVLTITTEYREVNFEAVKLKAEESNLAYRYSCTHKATCAWVGPKPSFSSVGTNPEESKWPERALKGSSLSSSTKIGTDRKFNATTAVLYQQDPPLEGVLTREIAAFSYSRFIMFRTLKIFFHGELYKAGKLCPTARYIDQLILEMASVNFEAVKTSDPEKLRNGYSHEATCVWIGTRPSLQMVSRTLPQMKFDLLNEGDRLYRGKVRKFCLPKVAFIVDQECDNTVCLHVSAFAPKRKLNLDYASGRDCISSFVRLNDVVEFKITRIQGFSNALSAIDVTVLTKKMETFAHENARVSPGRKECTVTAEKLYPSNFGRPLEIPFEIPDVLLASNDRLYNRDEESSKEIKQRTLPRSVPVCDVETLLTSLSERTNLLKREISSSAFNSRNEEIKGETSTGTAAVLDSLSEKSNFYPQSVPEATKETKSEMSTENISMSHSLSEKSFFWPLGTPPPVTKAPSEEIKREATSGSVPVLQALRENATVSPRPLLSAENLVFSSEEVPSKVFMTQSESIKEESGTAARGSQSQKRSPRDSKCSVQ